jgi:hypothetical protein
MRRRRFIDKDQLAHQFVACIYYVHTHHDLQPVSPTDKVRDVKTEADGGNNSLR